MSRGIRDGAKRDAQKAWDKVRAQAQKLERMEPGAGELYLLGAAAALDHYRAQRLSGVSGVPVGRSR